MILYLPPKVPNIPDSDRASLVSTATNLSAERLFALGSRGAGDLESDAATEGAGTVVVGNLHQAEVGHAAGGISSCAGGSGGDLDGERSISTNVGGTSLDADGAQGTLDDVALSVANHVGGGNELGACGVRAGTSGVDDSEEVTLLVVGSSVAGDDSPGTGDGTGSVTGNLGQGGAGLGDSLLHEGHGELAIGGGLAEAISGGVVGVATEDGGVLLGLGVGAELGDGSAFDAEGSAVATQVSSDDLDLSVRANQAGSGKGEYENGAGIHLDVKGFEESKKIKDLEVKKECPCTLR